MKKGILQGVFRILLGLAMTMAGIGHLSFQREEFLAQVPQWLPLEADLVVLLSGGVEIGLGLALLFLRKYRAQAGLALAIFYVLIFPGNIAQYVNGISAFGLETDQARLIRLFFQPVLVVWALWSTGASALWRSKDTIPKANSLYDFTVKERNGAIKPLAELSGKVVLVVNTATKCGLAPQFNGLEKLHQTYKEKGLVILGFPCNQFANQEPETNDTVAQACAINFGVSFPLMAKVDVNGANTEPLYAWLKYKLRGSLNDDIKWNFTKFLIDKNGKPKKRFAPTDQPEKIEKYIRNLLS